ncbi:DNA polymerase I [Syntrophobacter fumaroxidans]|uniref:DNA polymerase I n=1 Tax=Syntrophobacter fumaroxidans (strain DSM 10017 / MPOB) TaxID=335543 RepID=A0LIP7_SYNFM|nr:DNA polymerase I [Syntrophobacter fumaroxidans]ABK17299.1 DNA polymerase I [Syntrophobacter fumaroxidans MPOB]
MTEQARTFYLVDGSSYIYRAYYAVSRLTNSRGFPTGAVLGFAQMLDKVVREKKPDYICVVFDAPGPTFRHEMYAPYKATRQKAPEDMIAQIPYIKDLVRFRGIPQMELPGYEADDLIATLTHWAVEQDIEVVVVSSDKDLHQLIDDPVVRQWDPQKDRVFMEWEVEDRYGVPPGRMVDYLALVGDSSDNVPGVKGIGDKTARQLLQEWGSLDRIYANLARVGSASVRDKLEKHREEALLSRRLVSFREDVPVERKLEAFAPGPPLKSQLIGLFEELEFRSLLDSLRKELNAVEPAAAAPAGRTKHKIAGSMDELRTLAERLAGEPVVSIQVETTRKDAMASDLAGLSFGFEDDGAWYVPLGPDGSEGDGRLPAAVALAALEPVLGRSRPAKIGHDLKTAWIVFKKHGIELRGIAFDTMVAAYLLDPGKQNYGIDRVAAECLGENIDSYEDVTGKGKSQVGFDTIDIGRAAAYSCAAADAARRMHPVLKRKLDESRLTELFEKIELPLITVLARMEFRGITADAEKLESLSIDFQKALDRTADTIYDLAKEKFNIQSPKQLAYILFEKLGLRVVKKTKSGPSTDMAVLEELALEHPIADHVLVFRTLAKLKGTYADALGKLINPRTGRIHTSYNQTVAATGRLSSSDPNLQNIPIRTEEGRKIRSAFIPAPGWLLLSADYSQIELRILAHCSKDEHLLEAFRDDEDIHRRTAAEMFGVSPIEVTPEMRRQAKTINFGIIYGMGPFGLAQRLRISTKTARTAIDKYFQGYRGVRRFIDTTIELARRLGYSETLLGRRRFIPELQSRNKTIRQLGERLAINTPLQGTAADLIKKAMIDAEDALNGSGLRTVMLLQVHDELVFETPREELAAAQELVRRVMEDVWKLDVPLKVELGWGDNWAEAHA